MAEEHITKYFCDRQTCGEEFEPKREYGYCNGDVITIGDLKYMVKRNNSGSSNSNMSLILCPSCTDEFLKFMTGGGSDDY